jgi:flagellin
MRELAVQSASDGVNGDDRSSIDLEFQQLKAEITRISDATEYNNTKLINGHLQSSVAKSDDGSGLDNFGLSGDSVQAGDYTISTGTNSITITAEDGRSQTLDTTNYRYDEDSNQVIDADDDGTLADNTELKFDSLGITIKANLGITAISGMNTTFAGGDPDENYLQVSGGATVQVGANNVPLEDRIKLSVGDHTSTGLSLTDSDLTSLNKAQSAINELDTAIDKVNDSRGNIGSLQNRFEFTSSNLMNSIQNNSASMSTIRDADFAVEAADLARNQILTQSGTAMLAQANSLSQNVLSLIR